MKNFHRLLAVVGLLLGFVTCAGCLRQTTPFIAPASPTAVDWVVSGIFNEGGGMHGLGHAWFLWPTPVSPALTQEIEDCLERSEKDKVSILGPIRGEFAPIFCMDPPSENDIYETLPPIPHGVPFVWEVHRKKVRFSTEKLADKIDECRFFALAGPCQLHHCHFKCTIWWDETTTMGWPIPWSYTDHKEQVVYIDKDHLHRCGEPGNLTGPGGGIESYGSYAPRAGYAGTPGGYPAGTPIHCTSKHCSP